MKVPSLGKFLPLVAAILIAYAVQAEAVVILGNSTSTDLLPLNVGENDLDNYAYAVGFTMPGDSYSLSNVLLRLDDYEGPADAAIGLYSDAAGVPGSQLTLLNDPPGDGSLNNYVFTPSGSFILAANTSYWLVVAAEPGSNFFWIGQSETPTGVATFDAFRFSFDGGATFDSVVTGINPRFTINGEIASVPEGSAQDCSSVWYWAQSCIYIWLELSCRPA